MRKFDKAERWDDARMNLLGINAFKGVIPEGTSALHFMLWKFTLIALTKKSLEGDPIVPTDIIDKAMRRLREKIKAVRYSITKEKTKSESRGTTPDFRKFKRYIEGIGTVTQEGGLQLHDELVTLFSIL
jgi:hypothetical protein